MLMGEKYQSQVRKLIGFSAKNCAKMTKHPERFLKNQLSKKTLTSSGKLDKIGFASPNEVAQRGHYTQASDGVDLGQKAGPKWLQQYAITAQPDSTPNLSAQPVRFIDGCAFSSLAPGTIGATKRKTGLRQNASTASSIRPYNFIRLIAARCL